MSLSWLVPVLPHVLALHNFALLFMDGVIFYAHRQMKTDCWPYLCQCSAFILSEIALVPAATRCQDPFLAWVFWSSTAWLLAADVGLVWLGIPMSLFPVLVFVVPFLHLCVFPCLCFLYWFLWCHSYICVYSHVSVSCIGFCGAIPTSVYIPMSLFPVLVFVVPFLHLCVFPCLCFLYWFLWCHSYICMYLVGELQLCF